MAPERPDPGTPLDADLMARAASGDAGAFATLYDRHAAPVTAFVYHLTWDRAAAEDAVQETFLRLWRAAGRFRAGAPLEPWLYRIARRAAADARRRLARAVPPRMPSAANAVDASPGPAERAAGDEAAAALRAAVDELRERVRAAFVLVRIEGRSYAEAARLLDIPEGTVKSRVAAAEAVVRRRLGGLA